MEEAGSQADEREDGRETAGTWKPSKTVLWPSLEDGTAELTWRQRLARVMELRAILGLERFHQIDVARRQGAGWGITTGVHHMQHLPGLVFRAADIAVAKATLQRAQRLFEEVPRQLELQQDWERTPIAKDLVLVGGGHSHVNVLRMLGMEPLPGVRVTLITRDVETPYSGMLPGHIAGLYTRRECHLDLNILARFARVRLIHGTCVGVDLEQRQVLLAEQRPPIRYDILSINIGSAPRVQEEVPRSVTPVKPIDGFGRRWARLLERLPSWTGPKTVLVVGGGAGGFELAVTMHERLKKELAQLGPSAATVTVGLVTRSGLLPQHTAGARALAMMVLKEKGIELYSGYEVSHAETGVLRCRDGRSLKYDECIWCTQGSPQSWVKSCGLRTDQDGFLLVDQQMRCHRTDGQPLCGDIFAGGDIASVDGHPRPKAGVFAVMAGLVLWINLRATLRGEKLVTYWPQSSFLGLLNLGDGTCIASRGVLAAKGAWLWHLKDWIDRRWMWNYFEGLPEMPSARVDVRAAKALGDQAEVLLRKATMRCGGCGAKVGASTLTQAQVVLGAGDDAAVVDFAASASRVVSTVQTIDFFRTFIDDPYLMGQVSAYHALSDVEAMGAIPISALALVQIPYALEEKQEEDLVQLMAGASTALKSVGCALVGGHTCEARELGLGFAVTGQLEENAMKKSSMKPGDALVLTKRLGTGTLFAADMRAKARGVWVAEALRRMASSNGPAAKILHGHGANACTDVTGFGLIGHLLEMCSQSQLEATVELSKVPLYEGALETMAMGIESSLQVANVRLRRAVKSTEEVRARAAYPLLFDPQTSGGLLASLPKVAAESCVRELLAAGLEATVIGEVTGPASELEMITVALDLALKTFAFGLFPRWTNDELPCKLHSYTCVASPTEIPGAPGFTTLSGGQDGCLGLTPEGDVHRWVAKAGCARGFTMEWSLSILKDEVGQRLQLREVALSSGPVPDIRRPSFGEDPAVAAVALMDSGEVFASQAWYDEGQDGTMVCPDWRLVPSLQSVLVVSVACGGGYAMALTAGGGLMAWGSSLCGAMGLGAASHVSEPTLVQGELARCRVAVVACGESHTVAATFDEEERLGSVYSWGLPTDGRLGYLDEEAHAQRSPRVVPWLEELSQRTFKGTPKRSSLRLPQRITQVACGTRHSVLICQGTIVCFGGDDYGQLGRSKDDLWPSRPGQTLPPFVHFPMLEDPKRVGTQEEARRLCCGPFHSACVCSQGHVHVWGLDLRQDGLEVSDGPWTVPYFGPERPVVALCCGAHFLVCSAEVVLPRMEVPVEVVQEELLLGCCEESADGNRRSSISWRPSHLPPKCKEESEHHRSLVRELERSVQRRLLQEQREEQLRREREERRERRLQEHTEMWLQFLPSFVPGSTIGPQMQRLWRQGLPPKVREVVWPLAIGNVLRITPELFEIYSRGKEQSTTCIAFDLPRTFPTLAFFDEAYTCFRPDIGYVQGMSYLAAMLLLYLPSYQAFVGLCNLLNTPSVLGLYRLEPQAVACRARVFEQLCSQQLPAVSRCIRSVGLTPEMFLIDWFLTLFVKCLTVDVASVVWDLFLLDGEVVLYCTAIAILRILEDRILHPDGRRGAKAAAPDLESCCRVLNEELRNRVNDPDDLLWHIDQVRRKAPQRICAEIRAIENTEFGTGQRISGR
ncbi:unnamed protein product [Durusdinium trenchii]|uniref:Rab-GAP TBC domain-containing protein n=1 Tax=Durusdinium trenchii TaxID=1381693 RepID=A0ABP0QQA2_9DINO